MEDYVSQVKQFVSEHPTGLTVFIIAGKFYLNCFAASTDVMLLYHYESYQTMTQQI